MLDLTTAVGRIRSALGDAGTPSLHPDGDAWYAALLALVAGDEVAAWRAAAAGLALYLQQQAASATTGGRSIAYDPARISRLLSIAAGAVPWPYAAPTGGGSTFLPLEVTW